MADPVKPVEKLAPPPNVLPAASRHFSIRDSGYAHAEVDVEQPVGHTVDDALRPEYWVNHAHKLKAPAFSGEADRAGAILHLRTQDHAHYARLYVRAVLERGLMLQLLEKFDLGTKPVEKDSDPFKIRWNVGKRGYDVIRSSDNEIVGDASKFPTREMAMQWIAGTLKAA